MSDMRLVVAGAAGRMGRMLVQAIHAAEGAKLAGALERPGSSSLGYDAGILAGVGALGVPVTTDPLAALMNADGVIDFTTPDSTVELSGLAAQARIVHVIGTTGLCRDASWPRIAAAARHAVIVRSGNMSLGVNLLAALVRKTVAATLGRGLRHRDRRDASPHEGRRAVRHRADAGRSGGARAAASSCANVRCVRATATPARAATATSASRRCAAAPSSAITTRSLPAPAERIESEPPRRGPQHLRARRRARCAVGARTRSRDCTP